MFCKHEWEVLSEITTESRLEHMKKLEVKPYEFSSFDLERKLIQIITCPKCGALKRFVDTI